MPLKAVHETVVKTMKVPIENRRQEGSRKPYIGESGARAWQILTTGEKTVSQTRSECLSWG
jgi:hypothetical protein